MFKKWICLVPFLCSSFYGAALSDYVQEAAARPIAFSIVREDSLQDLEVIKRYFSEEKVSMLMVASGGCTAAKLIADAPLHSITLVDPNIAQLQLSKFKIQLLTLPPKKRMEILGYLPMDPKERKSVMFGLMQALDIDKKTFGNIDLVSQFGLDSFGRYEKVFEALRIHLASHQREIEALFSLKDVQEQSRRVASETPFGKAIDKAFDEVMSQNNLVKIFGEKATANRVQDFSRHFAERMRAFLSSNLASSSPWLAHMLLGHFHNETAFPWLITSLSQPLPKVNYFHGFMDVALEQSEPETYHVIHLSNIIDWLSPAEVEKTLKLAHRALKPGGVIILRQLNSNIDIPSIGKQYKWDLKASSELHRDDRSFFYRNFFLGFKPRPSMAPKVEALANEILAEIPVIEGTFFKNLETMTKEKFQATQVQFFFAVDYFSRPMSALLSRLPHHKDRIDIIHNIVEEHGDFAIEHYHSNTFKKFLETIGIDANYMDQVQAAPVVNAFNYTLMGVSANEDPILAIACNGIIEYAFADISALIAEKVVERGWVAKENIIHYNLHADIDKRHAEEFFKIIEPYMDDPSKRDKVVSGLKLGAYIFNRLYEDLYDSRYTIL